MKNQVCIEDSYAVIHDGLMHYQAAGKGAAIILLHSMASSLWTWNKVIEPLAAKYSVFALDTMGQGDSGKPARDYTIADYAESVLNFLKSQGIEQASIIGNSVGAIFAVQIAAVHPEKVKKLVLVGCPCRETEAERKAAAKTAREEYTADFMPLPRGIDRLRMSYVNISPKLQAKVNEDRAKAGIWAWKCTEAMNGYDIVPMLKKIKTETLLVYGEADRQREKEKALHNYIKGSQLVIVPEAGHLPQMDNPQEFLKVVEPFLES